MGLAKSYYMEIQERGWSPVDEKYLCRKCLESGNNFKPFFSTNSQIGICEYCKKQRKVVELNDLIGFVAIRVFRFYTDPVNELPYETAEGGYWGASMYEIDEILDDHISFNKDDVKDDILSAFDQSQRYCRVNPFADDESDTYMSYWDKFTKILKYERRFFFPRPKKERTPSIKYGAIENVGDILNFSVNEMKRQNLFKTLKKGQVIFRAREINPASGKHLNDEEYIIPDIQISSKKSSRLSPAGIPIFYGAYEKEHLSKEIRATVSDHVYCAEFQTIKPLTVLDLTKFEYPSIFIQENTYQYEVSKFISKLIHEIMIPVEHDGSEHLEYVPSQVFSEFLRHRFKYRQRSIDGVIYPSSFGGSGANLALYISNDKISYKGSSKPDAVLVLNKIHKA